MSSFTIPVVLMAARPYIRTIAAFLVYMRTANDTPNCYMVADAFLEQLDADVAQAEQTAQTAQAAPSGRAADRAAEVGKRVANRQTPR